MQTRLKYFALWCKGRNEKFGGLGDFSYLCIQKGGGKETPCNKYVSCVVSQTTEVGDEP